MKIKVLLVIFTIIVSVANAMAQSYSANKYDLILQICGSVKGNENNYDSPTKSEKDGKTCYTVNCAAKNSDAGGNEDGTTNYRTRCYTDAEIMDKLGNDFKN